MLYNGMLIDIVKDSCGVSVDLERKLCILELIEDKIDGNSVVKPKSMNEKCIELNGVDIYRQSNELKKALYMLFKDYMDSHKIELPTIISKSILFIDNTTRHEFRPQNSSTHQLK